MISLLVPTRQRPDNVKRMWGSARQTAESSDDIELVYYVDSDDPSYNGIGLLGQTKRVNGNRQMLSNCWNDCYKVAAGDILMHCGDDLIFRTQHWDRYIKNRFDLFDDKIVFVHGRDGNEDNRQYLFGTHGFIHRNWVDAVGYFVPPYFSSDFNDTWLNDVANIINRHVYEPEVLTEHMHPALGKAEWDQTHKERIARLYDDNMADLYYSKEMINRRMDDARKLLEVMQ